MLDLVIFLGLMYIAHYLGDFPLQSDAMATGKSKSVSILLSHVSIYTLTLLAFACLALFLGLISPLYVIFWIAANGALHFVTDYFTSKLTAKFHKAGRTKDFFGMIGLDQLIHILCILITSYFLFQLGGPIFFKGVL